MSLPVVAIVGRPNVGKSSLLNCLVGRRISIVDATPGVTRDRVGVPWALEDGDDSGYAELVDTGGVGIVDSDDLSEHVESQIVTAVAEASLILFIVDAREGVTPLDRHVAERLRQQDMPVLLVANKMDMDETRSELGDLHRLGFGEPMLTSAKHSKGLTDLRDKVAEIIGAQAGEAPDDGVMKLAIVGKRNAGKSTLINHLAGEQRVIVSEVPGTTRDSVDVTVERDGQKLLVIDTAGLRKKRRVDGTIDFYSHHRALRSVRRSDVVALMIDASLKVSQVDKELAGAIAEAEKPVVIVVNKWDLARDVTTTEDYADYFAKTFPYMAYAPICFASATEGLNVWQTVKVAEQLFEQSRTRVGTAKLNDVVEEILAQRGPSHKAGTRPPKIRYVSQIAVAPPTIVLFVNDTRSFDTSYRRFLVNQFRARLPYSEVPIRLLMRRGSKDRHEEE